ncbi:putative membrane protein [Halarchaeum rubridurum]|uniref:Branched-chain amino acid transport n=1 Tax=Halarchaeum rubridurum TaxID=489911 RepID=A0A830G4Q2_9EURY|nr:AzlD domain-containing protein [Halarchaeum rubridurum]MBP1955901.1 putative membrane protein [Halarchaeum rubridurum]GGM75262.1 branched-chain amino acid transport [Halarchaeum rubridurum]
MSKIQMNTVTLIAIVGMAVGTYLTRVGGYWLVSRFELTPRFQAWLSYVPGAILVSLIVPELAKGGPAKWGAALAALVVAWRSGNILYAMLAGIGVVLLLRHLPVFA